MLEVKSMPTFRSVNAGKAGPNAVGILVPPGSRTLVVVRPRALPVDLVMVRRGEDGGFGSGFMEEGRQTAGLEAQKLAKALMGSATDQALQVEVVPSADGGYWVQVLVDVFPLIACQRV